MNGLGLVLSVGFGGVAEALPQLPPPTDFAFSYEDSGVSITINLTWVLPLSGEDGVLLTFNNESTGTVEYSVLTPNASYQFTQIPYDSAWSSSIYCYGTGFSNSESVSISGTTPSAP